MAITLDQDFLLRVFLFFRTYIKYKLQIVDLKRGDETGNRDACNTCELMTFHLT